MINPQPLGFLRAMNAARGNQEHLCYYQVVRNGYTVGISVDNIISVVSGLGGAIVGYAGLRHQQRQAEIDRLTANERRLTRIEAELEDLKESSWGGTVPVDMQNRINQLENEQVSIGQTINEIFVLLSTGVRK